jgi:Ser/Thr protein kinase RdoA (MazF antagonist)
MSIDQQVTDTASALRAFDALTKGTPAPDWLHDGVVAAWALDPVRTTLTLITVSENATFVVRRDGLPTAVVRVARPGYMTDPAAFRSEAAWVQALAASGVVRVPRPIPTVTGEAVAVVRDLTGVDWACVSCTFVVGDILEDITDPVPYYREIGRTTALLHDHALAWTPPSGFRRHSWDLRDMVGPACRWGRWEVAGLSPRERDLLAHTEEVTLTALAEAPRSEQDWGLIHADLRPSNIMIDADGALTVIDFDDSGFSWFLYDFASALTFMEHVDDAPTMAQEWVAGYAEVRPLTYADLRLGCDLSMIRRLQMLGWTTTHREDALPPELWNAQIDGTLAVAERYLASGTWLLD